MLSQIFYFKKWIVAMALAGAFTPHLAASSHNSPVENQSAPATDEATKANDAYQAKDWPKAAEMYSHITSQQQQNGRAWYRLAVSLHGTGAEDQAIAAYEKSMQAGVPPGIGEYGLALVYASKKDPDNAFKYLAEGRAGWLQRTGPPCSGSGAGNPSFRSTLCKSCGADHAQFETVRLQPAKSPIRFLGWRVERGYRGWLQSRGR